MITIDRIKHEAYILFGEKDYRDTSMRDIANEVGIQPASIYSHFKSKEALFIDIFKNCTTEYHLGLKKQNDFANLSLEEKMLQLLKQQVVFLEEHPYVLKFLARVIFFPPIELKDKLQLLIKENKYTPKMKSYDEIYNTLKKNNKIKDTITIDQFASTFDFCIIRYFIGRLGLNYYEKPKNLQSIESIFNSHWKEIQNND